MAIVFNRTFGFALVLLLSLTGCASYTELPAGTIKPIDDSAVLQRQAIMVPPAAVEPAPGLEYRVGPGDVLFVNVAGRAELGSPANDAAFKGSRVDGNGRIRLPLIGSVPVAGLNVEEIQARLQERFSAYLQAPWVVVEVAEYKSQPLYLLGQFKSAGTYYMDRPLTLLQGLSLGGGLNDTANLRSARLIRDGQALPVDIYDLMEGGSAVQNVWLRPGDSIYVPDDKNQNVFVFGAVRKPGPVTMPNGQMTLPQALASAGLDEVGSNLGQIRIIRSLSATRGELLVVDLKRILSGASMPFALMEGDIVYAPRSGIGNWNQALAELLPSLQTVSALLQPFVSIQYLKNN